MGLQAEVVCCNKSTSKLVEAITLLTFVQEVTVSCSTGIPIIFTEFSADFLISSKKMPGYSKGKFFHDLLGRNTSTEDVAFFVIELLGSVMSS
jgi:hypothetical protein